jgi:hypothetical protein
MRLGWAGESFMQDGNKVSAAINAATGQPGIPDHPDLQRLLAYWSRQRGDRAFPRRQDIDPVDLCFMLNRIALTEIHDHDPRSAADDTGVQPAGPVPIYRFRVVGTWWRDLTGVELTGFWSDRMPSQTVSDITVRFYRTMTALRQPLFDRRNAWIDERRFDYQIMIMPLSEDGQRISMIMTGIGPHDA